MCELSSKARAFSVDALLAEQNHHMKDNAGNPVSTPINKVDLPLCMAGCSTIAVELCSKDLWQRFHALGTEMIITKAGRRMFPTVKIRLHGLNPEVSYVVFLDIVPTDNKRYRYIYHSSQWIVAGESNPTPSPRLYIHPDSPASGRLWMSQEVVTFDKLKLTNNKNPKVRGQISLHSMQKYIPRIRVLPISELTLPILNEDLIMKALTFTFKETEFVTVTAYQNQKITKLKIASNPFAKGFRDAIKNRYLDITKAPRNSVGQEICTAFSTFDRTSAFQKFIAESEESNYSPQVNLHPQTYPFLTLPRSTQASLLDPLFSNLNRNPLLTNKKMASYSQRF